MLSWSVSLPIRHSVGGREVRIGASGIASAYRELRRVHVTRRRSWGRKISVGRGRASAARLLIGPAEDHGPWRLFLEPFERHGRIARWPRRRVPRRSSFTSRFGWPSRNRVHGHGRYVRRLVPDGGGQHVRVWRWSACGFSLHVPPDPATFTQLSWRLSRHSLHVHCLSKH